MRTLSHHNQKTDTTPQLYCTLSTYAKPKTISRQNQKTDTTPQLYCTLSMQVTPKPISRQNQKLTHNSTTGKKVPPAHAQQVYSSLCHSVCGWVRAKRGIWRKKCLWEQKCKRVFTRKIGNFSISVLWENTTNFYLTRKRGIWSKRVFMKPNE